MTKLQTIICVGSVLLLFVMYFGCETTPPTQKKIEKERALTSQSSNIGALEKDAKANLSSDDANLILAIEKEFEGVDSLSKIPVLKKLSSEWYRIGRPDIAGYYAEEVAKIDGKEEAYSIAGTTYAICVQRIEEQKIKDYCTERAVKVFEDAISLNPDNTTNRVNLALCYTENPPENNPMKGILMLVDLVKKYPDNALVLSNLGRLAIKTGQWEKAKERLEKAYSIESENKEIICLLAQTYKGLNDEEQATKFDDMCGNFN